MKINNRTVESRLCPICTAKFMAEPSHNKQTCSEKCRIQLYQSKVKGKLKMSKLKKELDKNINGHIKEVEQHRKTIFAHEGSEGEVL